MKRILLFVPLLLMVFAASHCDQSGDEAAMLEVRVEALEKQNSNALKKQRALEYELEEQRLLAEQDAIERERLRTDEVRYALEQEGRATPGEVAGLLQRENALADRELILEGRQNDHFERYYDFRADPLPLSDEDLALAGRLVGGGLGLGAEEEEIDERDFYQELSPYGAWFESKQYGYVWQPAVSRDSSWRPYLRGRWACSDRGWAWLSNEPFGWATYHYGRWARLGNGRGWIWVPGTEWAPSWCTWRQSGSYLGWAPLPPATLKQGAGNCDPSADDLPGVDADCYTFVETENFDREVSRVCVPGGENQGRLDRAKNVTRLQKSSGRVFSGGPGYLDLAERMGRRIPYFQIERKRSDAGDPREVRPGVRARGERLVVTAPRIIPRVRELSRPPRVRGAIENSAALSLARFQPQVEIVEHPSRGYPDDDLRDRMAETLLPDLSREAWEAGFPAAGVEPRKMILPELLTAALKPVEVSVAEVTESEEGDESVASIGDRKGGAGSEALREERSEVAEQKMPSSGREKVLSAEWEAPRPQPAPKDDREREDVAEGKRRPGS